MSLFRPEVTAALARWREVIAAATTVALGLWVATRGGLILVPLGVIVMMLGSAWAVAARHRLRFARAVAAPGLVEVNEGLITYMGPASGGFAALDELSEIRLVRLQGRQLWRMAQTDGGALLVPVDASGAAALFDTFAALPGMDTGALVAALDRTRQPTGRAGGGTAVADAVHSTLVWRRAGKGVVPLS